jgi:hypothetical protein
MNILRQLACLLLMCVSISFTANAQRRRNPAPRNPPKPTVTANESTFDTLLAADSYKLYGEVRGVGQLIRSNSVNELIEPVLKLAGPPKEFKKILKWLNTHADEIMTSRMLVAIWPTAKDVPEALAAIEFQSSEEAAKFEPQLNGFLLDVLPPPTPESSPQSLDEPKSATPTDKSKETLPAKPNFYLKQVGPLLVISASPVTLKKLRPAGSKLLSEDANFQTARNRFNSESLFVFVDVKGIEKDAEERRKQSVEEEKKRQTEAAKQAIDESASKKPAKTEGAESTEKVEVPDTMESAVVATTASASLGQAPPPDPISTALSMLGSSFFSKEGKWPEAVGVALTFDTDSFDVRALMLNASIEKSDAVPILPMLIPGPPVSPESPSILPADTELFVTMSLDLPQIYSAMSKPPLSVELRDKDDIQNVKEVEYESPLGTIEKQIKIKIKDDLLPLLGSEVVVSLPFKELDFVAPGGPSTAKPDPGGNKTDQQQQPTSPSPVVAISLKDKEGMRVLLPKIIDSVGFKGASALAQTSRREDTEVVSYPVGFSYAFIGNFLVLSDTATTARVVDSYLKHETLSTDSQFKNYTRWQPRQLQGQIYVSPALMESYKRWAEQPSALIGDQLREFLTRLNIVAQPITYALSNEGLGPMHEIHFPKSLVLMAVAGFSGESNPPLIVQNERTTIGALAMIANAEGRFKTEKGAGSYGTLDQLVAEDMVPKDMIENHGYKLTLTISGNNFEVSAVPLEYGKSGRLSYFVDQTGVIRAGDHGGGAATSADDPLR